MPTRLEKKKPLKTFYLNHRERHPMIDDLTFVVDAIQDNIGGVSLAFKDNQTLCVFHDGDPCFQGQELDDRVKCVENLVTTIDHKYLKKRRPITPEDSQRLINTCLRNLWEPSTKRELDPNSGWSPNGFVPRTASQKRQFSRALRHS